ncbi:MAG: beta-ketoacyl-[acyl-carrier-protein] synthase family protein [Candidatus Acidiferrales bacterium]
MKRRVAITGIGMISALGLTVRENWSAMREGRPAIGEIRTVDVSTLRFRNGAEIRGFSPSNHFSEEDLSIFLRFTQLAVCSAREAVEDSGIEWSRKLKENTAVVLGAGLTQLMELNPEEKFHPLTGVRVMANAAVSAISIGMGLLGPAYALTSACASSNHALGLAMRMVRSGEVEAALAGGSEAPFCKTHLKAWDAMRAIDPDTCRPFSKGRRGTVLGEGAAVLVLEPLEAAEARGAKIYAEISGFGMSADAYHILRPSGDGAVRAMRAALEDADLPAEQVGYINAHGTGTQLNDAIETRAIRDVFGKHADRLAVSSTKSMHGHALGASGALEAVATVLALSTGTLPPTANFLGPDSECDLDVIPNVARERKVAAALSNSFGFGGLNAVLAFRAKGAYGRTAQERLEVNV